MVAPITPVVEVPETPAEKPENDGTQTQETEMVSISKMEHAKMQTALKDAQADAAKFRFQIKELLPKAEKGSELEKSIAEINSKLEASEKRALFLEQVIDPAVQCRNPKAAWLLAEAGEFFDRKGNPDFTALRAAAPELFGLPTARANAGNGTQAPPNPSQSMNAFIRKSVGRDI